MSKGPNRFWPSGKLKALELREGSGIGVSVADSARIRYDGTSNYIEQSIKGSPYSPFLSSSLDVFSVKTYGAWGNGIHDDAPALRDAYAAAALVGGTVFVPTGTYLLDTIDPTRTGNDQCVVIPKSNVRVTGEGYGSCLKIGNNLGAGVANLFGTKDLQGGTEVVNNASWDHLRFDGNGANNTNPSMKRNAAIFVEFGSNCSVSDCYFNDWNGFHLVAFGGISLTFVEMIGAVIERNQSYNVAESVTVTDHSTWCLASNDGLCVDNISSNPPTNINGLDVTTIVEFVGSRSIVARNVGRYYGKFCNYSCPNDDGIASIIANNTATNITHGIDLWTFQGGGLVDTQIYHNTFGIETHGTLLNETGITAIQTGSAKGIVDLSITDNVLYMMSPGAHGPMGVAVSNCCHGLAIDRNIIRGFSLLGVNLQPAIYSGGHSPPNYMTDLSVCDNKIIDCGTASWFGISLNLMPAESVDIYKRVRVSNNQIIDTAGPPTMVAGINIAGYIADAEILDNQIPNCTGGTQSVLFGPSCTRVHCRPLLGSSASVTPGALPGTTSAEPVTATVYAITQNSNISVTPPTVLPVGLIVEGYYKAANTVGIVIHNPTTGPLTCPSGVYNVSAERLT